MPPRIPLALGDCLQGCGGAGRASPGRPRAARDEAPAREDLGRGAVSLLRPPSPGVLVWSVCSSNAINFL